MMQHTPETPREGARRPPVIVWWAIGCLAALAVLTTVAYFAVPYPVSVDGRTHWVTMGTPLTVLKSQGVVTSRPGDLVSVRGKILTRGGGKPATVYVNGKSVGPDARIWPGSTVRTVNGANRREKIITVRVALPMKSEVVGSGPVTMLSQEGAVGLREVTKGKVSGDIISSKTLIKPVPTVFVKTEYGAKGRVIALTFDDGPQTTSTPAILAILRKFKVKATFFMIGQQVRTNPDLARAVLADGHLIGNHSWGHKILGRAPKKTVVSQIGDGAAMIKKVTGFTPTWFRPPEGSLSKTVYEVAQAANERVIMWSVDPYDWNRPAVPVIVKWVVSRAQPGAVVIMHDGGGDRSNTVAALPQIITQLRAQGYQFATLDQMFGSKPVGGVLAP